MKETLLNDWQVALLSGKYKQGPCKLYNMQTGEHCALGVLCAVAGIPYTYAAIRSLNIPLELQFSIQYLNDIRKLSFKEIAKVLS